MVINQSNIKTLVLDSVPLCWVSWGTNQSNKRAELFDGIQMLPKLAWGFTSLI